MDERSAELVRLTARVNGRVQGVGFRHFVRSEARRLGLDGWVRNDRDGSVTVVAEGPRDRLERLESRLRRGPPAAAVAGVNVSWDPATGEFESFGVRHL